MRIVADLWSHPSVGSATGSTRAAAAFLDHAAHRGHHVTVVTSVVSQPSTTPEGVELYPGGMAWTEYDADILIDNWNNQTHMAKAARRIRAAYVTLVQSWELSTDALLRQARPRLVWFPSEATRAACGWEGSHVVAHPPVDPEAHRTTPGDRVTIVNLSDRKGGPLFWDLADTGRDMLAVHGGWGEQVIPRDDAGELDIPSNVDLIPCTQDMPGDVWSRTRVLLIPSESESWCMVALEAMCSGIPVIAHPSPGIREACGDAAIWVDRNDPQAWRDTLDRLDDPEEYAVASKKSSTRAETLDPTGEKDKFVDALEALCV